MRILPAYLPFLQCRTMAGGGPRSAMKTVCNLQKPLFFPFFFFFRLLLERTQITVASTHRFSFGFSYILLLYFDFFLFLPFFFLSVWLYVYIYLICLLSFVQITTWFISFPSSQLPAAAPAAVIHFLGTYDVIVSFLW